MKRVLPIAALLILALGACQEAPMGPVAPEGPPRGVYSPPSASVFRPEDFTWSTAPGPASISGDLVFRDGPIRYGCAGEDVILIPETPWSRRRMTILYGSPSSADVPMDVVRSRMSAAANGDYRRFARAHKCDAAGHFAFEGLPDGGWFVITVARPVGIDGEPIAIMRRVETRGGHRRVELN